MCIYSLKWLNFPFIGSSQIVLLKFQSKYDKEELPPQCSRIHSLWLVKWKCIALEANALLKKYIMGEKSLGSHSNTLLNLSFQETLFFGVLNELALQLAIELGQS